MRKVAMVKHATEEEKLNAPYKVSGYHPSPRSHKDWIYGSVMNMNASDIPSKVWRDNIVVIQDQQSKGACTGFSGSYHTGVSEYPTYKQWLHFSEDFLYNLAQQIDGIDHTQPGQEEGSTGLAIMQVKQKYGVCLASTLPYNPDPKAKINIPKNAFDEALKYRIKNYAKIQTVDEIKHAIAQGKTVLSGVLVTDSFMHCENGFVGLPFGTLYGGHEIDIQDFDDNLTFKYSNGQTLTGFFRFPNSWNTSWGDKGYGYLPYAFFDYVTDLGMHFYIEGFTSVDLDSNPTPVNPEPIVPPQPKKGYSTVIELYVGKDSAYVNSHEVKLNQVPVLDNDTVLVPVRFIGEADGFEVIWQQDLQKVTLRK